MFVFLLLAQLCSAVMVITDVDTNKSLKWSSRATRQLLIDIESMLRAGACADHNRLQ